jgi:uncharacterized surface protein with fasciclin (FAS1) repeats
MKRIVSLTLLLIVALAVAACAPAAPGGAPAPAPAATEAPAVESTEATEATEATAPELDIVDTAVGAGSFSTLVAAVQAAELESTLRGDGPFTVFAPTDEAFAALPAGTVEELLKDPKGQLTQILLYHVVPNAAVLSGDLSDGMSVATAQGAPVTISVQDGKVMVNGANVVQADIQTKNGVIHVIDAVILPPSEEAAEEAVAPGNIAEVAAAAGTFNTLLQAVQAAGLAETLAGEGPFTVFAPTDDAFAAVPADQLQALLADPEALKQVLLYHVVAGAVMSTDLTDGMEAATVQGAPVKFMLHSDGAAMVNDANIVAADIPTSNGVIHVIDKVILPPAGN